jgi:hypothetical protein
MPITADDTSARLHDKLAQLGSGRQTLDRLRVGGLRRAAAPAA